MHSNVAFFSLGLFSSNRLLHGWNMRTQGCGLFEENNPKERKAGGVLNVAGYLLT